MEIKEMMQKLWGAPQLPISNPIKQTMQENPPKPRKSDIFDPATLAEAQSTFKSSGAGGPSPSNGTKTPQNGTVGNLIPPGWSSQAAEK